MHLLKDIELATFFHVRSWGILLPEKKVRKAGRDKPRLAYVIPQSPFWANVKELNLDSDPRLIATRKPDGLNLSPEASTDTMLVVTSSSPEGLVTLSVANLTDIRMTSCQQRQRFIAGLMDIVEILVY